MNFFGYISINAALAQMLGGLLIGMVAGLCAPSGYELAQPIEYRQKVWFQLQYSPGSLGIPAWKLDLAKNATGMAGTGAIKMEQGIGNPICGCQ